jgi:hypothetical protein
VRQIIKRGWSVDADVRDSFASIFEALKEVAFKVRPGVDTRRVTEYLALVERQAAAGPMDTTGGVESEQAAADGIRSGRRVMSRRGQHQNGTPPAPTQPTVPRALRADALARNPSRNACPPVAPPPLEPAKQFPPSLKTVKTKSVLSWGRGKEIEIDVPDGIIAHLTRGCGGNVHDRHIVDVTSGSFEKETEGTNPHSGAYDNDPRYPAKNAADLETDSIFSSAWREKEDNIPHTRNNWVCYDFKRRRIGPTHYAIRTHNNGPGGANLKSWLIETSGDGESWREVSREEGNEQLNGEHFTGIFAVAGGEECRFIRLVNIGRNHRGYDGLLITAWEIFGGLLE